MGRTGEGEPNGHGPGDEPGQDDGRLVAALRAGDERAFSQWVRDRGPSLLAVARRFLPREEDARDCVQETFLQALRALPRFRGESRLSTWLHRILVNTALMTLRSRRSRPEESIEPLLPTFIEDGHPAQRFEAWPIPADELVARAEIRRSVRSAIDRLPPSYRTVLLLRDIEGLDTAESAAALGISANAVKIRLHRARQALRELIDPMMRAGFA